MDMQRCIKVQETYYITGQGMAWLACKREKAETILQLGMFCYLLRCLLHVYIVELLGLKAHVEHAWRS